MALPYGGAFLFGNATKRPIPQTTKRQMPFWGFMIMWFLHRGRAVCAFSYKRKISGENDGIREMVFAVTKLQQEVT